MALFLWRDMKRAAPVVGAALGLVVLEEVCAYLAFTLAIPTTKRSLIIRTEIRTKTRERLKTELFIWALDIRSIIGRNGIPSRGESQSVYRLKGLRAQSVRGSIQKPCNCTAVLAVHFFDPRAKKQNCYGFLKVKGLLAAVANSLRSMP
jgi:hypothetical protein